MSSIVSSVNIDLCNRHGSLKLFIDFSYFITLIFSQSPPQSLTPFCLTGRPHLKHEVRVLLVA